MLQPPSAMGMTGACGTGMGGTAFVRLLDPVEPILWRAPFDMDVHRRLITRDHPRGMVTNSDLELAATVVHHDILAQHFDMRKHTIHMLHDNTPAQHWPLKGSTTTAGPVAYLL